MSRVRAMPLGPTTIQEVAEMFHPRASGFFADPGGLVGFRTVKTVRQRLYSGSRKFTVTRIPTVLWYAYDSDSGQFVRVGTSNTTGRWSTYYKFSALRNPRRGRR